MESESREGMIGGSKSGDFAQRGREGIIGGSQRFGLLKSIIDLLKKTMYRR